MRELKTALLISLLGVVSIQTQSSPEDPIRHPCKGVPDGTFVQEPSSCEGWLQCSNGEAKSGRCKEGYRFDRRTASCNYKDKVDCVTRNPCKGRNDGTFVKSPASCAGYFVCMREEPRIGECPDGLNFNPIIQECVHPSKYPCNSTGPSLEDIVCQGLPDYSFVENERACGEYFVCVNERGRAGRCPDKYLYNTRKGICDFKDAVKCSAPTPPPEPEKNACDGVENGKFIKDASSCPAYFQCIDGQPIPGRCDNGFWFNPENGICDYPEKVKCTPNVCEGKKNGEFFADPAVCGAFIQCVDGVGKPGSCPDGLLFNPMNGYCDYKENVDCGSEQPVPTTEPTQPPETPAPETPPTETPAPETPPTPPTPPPEEVPASDDVDMFEDYANNFDVLS